MGKQKYAEDIRRLFERSPVISSKSIERVIKSRSKNGSTQYPKQMIKNMIMTGKIKMLSKGCYTSHDDPSLAVFCFKPAYLGLQDALSFHNLWEQETIPVVITSKKIRQGIRDVMGSNLLVRRLDKRYIFGYEYYLQDGRYMPYSDIEKTFIDMAYFREKMNEEVLMNMAQKINREKLDLYLKRYPKIIQKRVLNLLLLAKAY